MTDEFGIQQPEVGTEQTVKTTPATPVASTEESETQLKQKLAEAEAQKEHWRNKYQRDVANVAVTPPSLDEDDEMISDEGKILNKKIKTLESELADTRKENTKKDILLTHPELKDKWIDVEEFMELPENRGMTMKTAAKAFLVEKGLLETPRRGLEATTGGSRTPSATGTSAEDLEALRQTNYREWFKRVMEDRAKIN